MKRNCDHCGREYEADQRNVNRGWGLCCSKSCAASKREKSKTGYNTERVKRNNIRRATWNENGLDENDWGVYKGRRTSEGYKIYGTTAINEWGDAVYEVDPYEDTHPFSMDAFG